MAKGTEKVREYRRLIEDAFFFNWSLTIADDFQQPFDPTHENMAQLELNKNLPQHKLAANLRRAFSGIVAGNVKAKGIKRVQQHGPYQLTGDKQILAGMDKLLSAMVAHGRMKIQGEYTPCYEIS